MENEGRWDDINDASVVKAAGGRDNEGGPDKTEGGTDESEGGTGKTDEQTAEDMGSAGNPSELTQHPHESRPGYEAGRPVPASDAKPANVLPDAAPVRVPDSPVDRWPDK